MPAGRAGVTSGEIFFPPGLGPRAKFFSPQWGGEIFFSRASAGGEFFFSPPSGLDPGENFSSPTGGRKIFPRASAGGGGNGRPPPGLLRLPRGRDFPRWSYHQAPGRLPLGQERSLGGGKFIFPPRTGRPISRPISISPLPLSGGGPGHPSAQGSGRLCEPGPPGESGQSLGGRGFIQTGVTQGFPRGGVPPAGFFQGFG